ncbi:hypothetical protein Tco_1283385 [Tanacetum coccineum]
MVSLTLLILQWWIELKLDEDLMGIHSDPNSILRNGWLLMYLLPVDPTLYSPFACVLRYQVSLPKSTLKLSNVVFGNLKGKPLNWSLGNPKDNAILVSWSSKKQRSTAISTTEAEYIAMSGMLVLNPWMRSQLKRLQDLTSIKIPLNTMAEQNVPNQPPTRTDEQIVPRSQWLTIGKSNLLFNAQKIQKNPIFQISVDILSNTNFFQAFTASAITRRLGKAVVTKEQVAHSLIDLSKKKRTADQFILVRRDQTPPDLTTGPSSQPDDDTSEKVIHESSSTSDSERTESETEAAAPKGDKDQDEVDTSTVTSGSSDSNAPPPVIAPFTDVSSSKPSLLVTPPPINTEATTITTSLPEITPLQRPSQRVARLEARMSEVKKTITLLMFWLQLESQMKDAKDKEVVDNVKDHKRSMIVDDEKAMSMKALSAGIKPGRVNKEEEDLILPLLGQLNLLRKMMAKVQRNQGSLRHLLPNYIQLSPQLDGRSLTQEACVDSSDAQIYPESEHSEQSTDDISKQDNGECSDMEDTDNAHIPKSIKGKTMIMEFHSINMVFSRRTGKKKLCKADLEGPTFNLVKAFHKNSIFLQYQMDECHKLLTNKLTQIQKAKKFPYPYPSSKPLVTSTSALKNWFHRYGLRVNANMTSVRSMAFTHWWFRRKELYINKHSESSDREAVRSQMQILSVISVKKSKKLHPSVPRQTRHSLHTADQRWYKKPRPHKGVKASANSDVMYFFTSAQDGDPSQDDVRLCLGDDLKKAQDHSQRQAIYHNKQSNVPSNLNPIWFQKTVEELPEQSLFNELVDAEEEPKENELQNCSLLKGRFKNSVELQYNLEQCRFALLDKIDWANLEGYRFHDDLSQPLPLVGPLGIKTIPISYCYNHDLEYLMHKNEEKKFALSASKIKATRYEDEGIEEMILYLLSPAIKK